MSKPNPYCECHKWDQPGGICAYCVGYTDGWTSETTALRRERDALRLERDAVAREGWRACVLGVSIIRFWQAEAKSRSGDQRGALVLMNEAVALRDIFTAEDKAAGTGVG